jgi:hypothetical protein
LGKDERVPLGDEERVPLGREAMASSVTTASPSPEPMPSELEDQLPDLT